jgi:type II secretory pathway component PulF
MEIVILLALLAVYIYLGLKKPGVALITSPFLVGTLIVAGAVQENFFVIAGAPIIFITTLLMVLVSKQEPGSESWPQTGAKWFFIILGSLFLLFLSLIALSMAFSPLGIFWIILVAMLIVSIVSYSITSRHTTSAFVISTIGSSIRQNLPLPMALESAASDRSDKRSIILQNIKKWLVQGYPLSESIKRGYPKCPGYAVAMIAAAERINQLPLALKAIEANISAQTAEDRKIRPVHPIYPVIVITLMFFIILGVMTFIIPQYSLALEDMFEGAKLPAATRVVLHIMNFLTFQYGWLFGILLLLIILIVIPVSIYVRFRPRRPDEPFLLSKIGDFIKWHLPVLHWFERNYSMVQVVEMLRLSLNAGCPVNDAIDNAIGLDVNIRFRKRLKTWHEKVEQGQNIASAVRESKLGPALAWAFDDRVNQGNTPAILETLEAFYRSNYSYCVNLARFIFWPCIVLCMGITVGFVVLAIFSPSIAIITHLTTLVTP